MVRAIPAAAGYLFEVVFAAVSLAIVWGAMAERTRLWVYFAFGVAFTLIYSLVSHWIWSPDGWLFASGMQDFAGSTVVHYQGALAGLAGRSLLGPRIGKYGADGKPNAIPGHNMAFTTLGVIILWFGWFGFNPGSTLTVDFGGVGFFAYVALTTNLAAAAGVLGAVVTSWLVIKKPDLSMMLNGAIAALVAITAACAFVAPWAAILIGFVAGVIVVLGVLSSSGSGSTTRSARSPRTACPASGERSRSASSPCRSWPRTSRPAQGGLFYGGGLHQLGTQALGLAAVGAFTFTASFVILFLFKVTIGIRTDSRGRRRGPRRVRARHVGLPRVLHPGSRRLRHRDARPSGRRGRGAASRRRLARALAAAGGGRRRLAESVGRDGLAAVPPAAGDGGQQDHASRPRRPASRGRRTGGRRSRR